MNGQVENQKTSKYVPGATARIGTEKGKLTQKKVKSLLHYDNQTGLFRWKADRSSGRLGSKAGYVENGRLRIRVEKVSYLAHRLAHLYMEGYFPEHQIDHKDGDPLNNKWENLRHVTQSCNLQNSKVRSTNTSGFPGVSWRPKFNKFVAQIRTKGKTYHLGCYNDPLDAALARFTCEDWCDDWKCNYRGELVKAINNNWPEFNLSQHE